VVGTMSYVACPQCGGRPRILGEGGGAEAARPLSVPLLGEIPLCPPVRVGGDQGSPVVLSEPDSPAGQALIEAARALARSTRSVVGKPLQLTVAPGARTGNGHDHA